MSKQEISDEVLARLINTERRLLNDHAAQRGTVLTAINLALLSALTELQARREAERKLEFTDDILFTGKPGPKVKIHALPAPPVKERE